MDGGLSFGLAFFAGLASFLSPCVFALVPAYISYLSGRSAASSDDGAVSWRTFSHGLAFVLGFSLVFIIFGALAGLIGSLLRDLTDVLVKIGGVIVILFGLHMTKIIQIPLLNYDLRPQSQPDRKRGYLSSALMGVFFSAGWSPCVGPVLGTIMTLSIRGGNVLEGGLLLAAYSAGLAIPFLIAATQIGWVTNILKKHSKVMHWTEIIMGVVMIILGILLFFGTIERLATLPFFFEDFDEILLGKLLTFGLLGSVILGLIPGYIGKKRGKKFIDQWFLGSGIALVLLVILYFLGAFNSLLPLIL